MNKLSLLAILLLSCSITALAQRGSIKGVVVDSTSKAPIEHATVAVINSKDTSLISYTLTQKDGSFKLTSLPVAISNRVVISFMRNSTYKKALKLKANEIADLGQISLGSKSLQEITIKAERDPIVIKKDTVEFAVEAFKTRPNAVVEDLLRLLPGVQVNYDGTILYNGKKVNSLRIDGKRFFGDDPKVATKNLDADMLDKVQIYDDHENDPDHKISDKDVGKIINLKMKSKIKKSTLGKLYAGIGTRGRHEMGGILSNFRDTLQVSLIGVSNNLNQTGFSSDELYNMGGFNRSQGSQAWDGTFGGQSWGGIQSINSGGLNINNDYGDKLRMNLTYFYTGTNTDNKSKNVYQQTIGSSLLSDTSGGVSNQWSKKHALSGTIEWKPDTTMRIFYKPSASFTTNASTNTYTGTSSNNISGLLSTSVSQDKSTGSGNSFAQEFTFYHKLGHRGKSITISHNLSLNNDGTDEYGLYNTQAFVAPLQSQLLDRYTNRRSSNNTVEVSADYYHPFTKNFYADITTTTNYSTTVGKEFVYNHNNATNQYNLFDDSLSKNLSRHLLKENIKPSISYKFKHDITVKLRLGVELQKVTNYFNLDTVPNLSKQYYLLFPSGEISFKGFSASYNEGYNLPSIDNMLPVTRIYAQSYRETGNPNLTGGKIHEISFNYYNYNNDKQLNKNFYTGITLNDNAVVQKATVDAVGIRTTTYVNRNNSISAYFGGNISKDFKARQKWQIGLSNNFSGNYQKSAFFLNGAEGTQNSYNFTTTQNVNFNYNSIISFNTNYKLQANTTRYQQVNYATVNNLTHTVGTNITLRWPAHFIFDAKYAYNYRPNFGNSFQRNSNIVDLATTFLMFNKDRGQVKLYVYDLFDQNVTSYRQGFQNAIYTTEMTALKRYFMLSFQYKITSYKSK